jgi:hypothetical protein
MSYTSNYNLNIRLSNLESKINGGGIPTSSTLADVLLNGDSAGASDIDMNNNDILNCNDLQAVTINGNPIGGAQDIDQVLATGDTATGKQILLNATAPSTDFTLYKPDEIQVSDGATITTFFTPTTLTYDDGTAISATWEDIINTTNTPIIPTLQEVLTAGSTAQDPLSLALQNTTLSTAVTLFGNSIDIEVDDGINTQLLGLTYNAISHTGNVGDNFTLSATENILISSDNLNMSATALTIPAIGQPITAQLTQDGLTMLDTTNLWNSWYRKSSAFVSNLAGTIYTYITNTTIQLVDLTTNTSLTATGITSGASSATWASIIAGGASATLQSVLTAGNTATGASALIGLTNSGVGYTSNPQLTLNNSNATAGATTGVPSVEYYKSGRNAVAGDTIASQSFYGKDDAGTKTEFVRIETLSQNVSSGGNKDGTIVFKTLVNNVFNSILTLNGSSQEIEIGKPIDLNGNAIKTSSGDLTLTASTTTANSDIDGSTTDGNISFTANTGAGGVNGFCFLNADRGVGLASALGGSNGNIILDVNNIGDLQLEGTTLISPTAGGNSGQHLRIKLNGTYYKIQLLND